MLTVSLTGHEWNSEQNYSYFLRLVQGRDIELYPAALSIFEVVE